MEEGLDHLVYSKNVLEFVTVGNEFCVQLENADEMTTRQLFTVLTRILPLLYIKTIVLPKPEFELEEEIEKTVREEDYVRIQHGLLNKLGQYDDFLEVYVPGNEMEQADVAQSISENLADIYQYVKDFLFAYRIGVTEIMNDALAELVNGFEMYWGQKMVNVLRACHHVLFNEKELEEDLDFDSEILDNDQKSNKDWFNRFQDQWQDDEEI